MIIVNRFEINSGKDVPWNRMKCHEIE